MRIISGKFRGSALFLPKNKKTRPLKDLARESIFNLLIHSNKIGFRFENSKILDLYAGTGSFGLECLSRGAKYVSFVEKEKSAIDILKKNIHNFNLTKKTKIFSSDVLKFINEGKLSELKYDLVFLDPPFELKDIKKIVEEIFEHKILNKNGVIILHRNKNTKEDFPNYFTILDQRKYGISKIIFAKFLF